MTREERRLAARMGRWALAGLLIYGALNCWLLVALRDALAAAMW